MNLKMSKLPNGRFEPERTKINDEMYIPFESDNSADCIEQFSGRSSFYFGNGNSRNGVPIFGYSIS
jgi:hypothetical protein